VEGGIVMPGRRKMVMWVKEGVEGNVKAYWVGERTWGVVRMGREGRTRAIGEGWDIRRTA